MRFPNALEHFSPPLHPREGVSRTPIKTLRILIEEGRPPRPFVAKIDRVHRAAGAPIVDRPLRLKSPRFFCPRRKQVRVGIDANGIVAALG